MDNVKEAWIETFSGRRFDILDPKPEQFCIEDIAHSLSLLCRFTGHCKHFYCVTPETRVLTANMEWKPAGELILEEDLLGFDEDTRPELGLRLGRRKLRRSIVKHTGIIQRQVYKLTLSDGTVLRSSGEHPWLVCTKVSRNQTWFKTSEIFEYLNNGKKGKNGRTYPRKFYMLRFLDTWKEVISRDAGYISGIFDGEGYISIHGRNDTGFSLGFAQKTGVVLDESKRILDSLGIKYGQHVNEKNNVNQIIIAGKWCDRLKFLGTVRPKRLVKKINGWVCSGNLDKEFDSIDMLSIESAEYEGIKDVVALETSTHTYFAEGFGAHNSVAQHSILGSNLIQPEFALQFLLHDASESFLGDLNRPTKHATMAGDAYRQVEARIQACIYTKFGLPEEEPEEIKTMDNAMLYAEKLQIMKPMDWDHDWGCSTKAAPVTIIELLPRQVERMFLDRFKYLTDN